MSGWSKRGAVDIDRRWYEDLRGSPGLPPGGRLVSVYGNVLAAMKRAPLVRLPKLAGWPGAAVLPG